MTHVHRLGAALTLVSATLGAACASRTASPADAMMVRLDVVERALLATESEVHPGAPHSASSAPAAWSTAQEALKAADAALVDARNGVSIWRAGDARYARPRLDALARRLDAVRAALDPLGVSPSPGLLEVLEPPAIDRANVDAGPAPPPNQG